MFLPLANTLSRSQGSSIRTTATIRKKPCKSINWAVSHAQSGDTISVAAGHYVENVSVSKNLTIKGVGAYLMDTPITWVDDNKQGNVFTVAATATIKSMLISNGKNGISNDGNLTVEGCLVGGSDGAGDGSGIKNLANGTLVLKRVWLVGNKSAGLFNVGSATLDEIWAFANKDGIVNGPMPTSSLDVSNSVIWNNKMVGVVNHETKKLSMQNVTISGNEQTGLEQYGKLASLDYVTISKNGVETNGQGIRAAEGGGGVTITHSIVYGNGPPGLTNAPTPALLVVWRATHLRMGDITSLPITPVVRLGPTRAVKPTIPSSKRSAVMIPSRISR
jgi:hypothetical protein